MRVNPAFIGSRSAGASGHAIDQALAAYNERMEPFRQKVLAEFLASSPRSLPNTCAARAFIPSPDPELAAVIQVAVAAELASTPQAGGRWRRCGCLVAGDWRVPFNLTGEERELVLRQLRMAVSAAPADSPLTPILVSLEQQVAAGEDELRLEIAGRLDLIGMLHWSELLSRLSTPTGRVRCGRCKGIGEVDLPAALTNLPAQFDFDFHLTQLGPPEREPLLQQSSDPVVRAQKAAEHKAELVRQRDAQRQADRRSYGVPAGTPRKELVDAGGPDFIPGRGR